MYCRLGWSPNLAEALISALAYLRRAFRSVTAAYSYRAIGSMWFLAHF